MLKRFLLLGNILLTSIISFGQRDVTIASPNAASLGQYGQVPVNLSTGTVDLSLPIFSKTINGTEVGIDLNYAATGVRVNQYPTWVGLGWDLRAGGTITRVINGACDDKYPETPTSAPPNHPEMEDLTPIWGYYFLKHRLNRTDWSEPATMEALASPPLGDSLRGYQLDLDPDEFIFTFGKHSGKFYMDHEGNWKVYTNSPTNYKVNVELDYNYKLWTNACPGLPQPEDWMYSRIRSLFKRFTITTDDGVKYIFGGDSSSIEFSRVSVDRLKIDDDGSTTFECPNLAKTNRNINPTSWQLKHIIFPNGDSINYRYERGREIITRTGYASFYSSKSRQTPDFFSSISSDSRQVNSSLIYNLINPVYLTEITSKAFNIEFKTSASNDLPTVTESGLELKIRFQCYDDYDRGVLACDMDLSRNGTRKLDTIIIRDYVGKIVDRYTFSYIENPTERLKLSSVRKIGSTGGAINMHGFVYNSQKLPAYHSLEIDHWGYYNGFSYFDQPGILNSVKCEDYPAYYVSRSPNQSLAQAEVLTELHYPTGAYSKFEYELNRYSKIANLWPDFQITENTADSVGGGLRVKRITDTTTNQLLKDRRFHYVNNYANGNTLSSGIIGGKFDYLLKNEYQLEGWWKQECSMGSGSVYPLSFTNGGHLTYSEVTEQEIGKGYTVHQFSNHDNGFKDKPAISALFSYNGTLTGSTLRYPFASLANERGKEIAQLVYDQSNKLLFKKNTIYNIDTTRFQQFIRAMSKTKNESAPFFAANFFFVTVKLSEASGPQTLVSYPRYYYPTNTSKITTVEYSQANNDNLKKSINYFYDYTKSNNITRIENTTSQGYFLRQDNKYAYDFSSQEVYDSMTARFMIGTPVETIKYKDGSTLLNADKTEFGFWSSGSWGASGSTDQILPRYVKAKELDGDYDGLLEYTKYATDGKLLEQQKNSGAKEVYLWGYGGNYPVAKVSGSDYNTISGLVDMNVINNTTGIYTESQMRLELNKIRTGLQGTRAQVFTYTYKPLVGIISETDPKGKSIFYEYDAYNRLHLIKDIDGNILKRICYNYSGYPQDCGIGTIFYNQAQSSTFQKNNCGTGFTGSNVNYTVPANKYSASTLVAANAMALEEVTTNGQAYANATGTCSPSVASVYARLEYENGYAYEDNGPDGSYYHLEQGGDLYIRFYSDAACTNPAILSAPLTYNMSQEYIYHLMDGTETGSDLLEMGTTTVPQGVSSYYLGDPGWIFYKHLEYDGPPPHIIISEYLESNRFIISDAGTGLPFTPAPTKFSGITIDGQYFFQ